MVRVIGVQKVELGVVDLILSYPSFKFRSVPRRRKKELTLEPLQLLGPRTPPIQALFSVPPIKLVCLLAWQRSSLRRLQWPVPSAFFNLAKASTTTGSPRPPSFSQFLSVLPFPETIWTTAFLFYKIYLLLKNVLTKEGIYYYFT